MMISWFNKLYNNNALSGCKLDIPEPLLVFVLTGDFNSIYITNRHHPTWQGRLLYRIIPINYTNRNRTTTPPRLPIVDNNDYNLHASMTGHLSCSTTVRLPTREFLACDMLLLTPC